MKKSGVGTSVTVGDVGFTVLKMGDNHRAKSSTTKPKSTKGKDKK